MADENICSINLEGLNKEDQDAVKEYADGLLKNAKELDIDGLNDKIEASLKDYEEFLKAAYKINKRNAYINKIKQQDIVDHVLVNWEKNPGEGIAALLVGSQVENVGSRASASVAYNQKINVYKGLTRALLFKDNVWNEYISGVYDKDIYKAIDALDRGVEVEVDDVARKIATTLKRVNDLIRKETNRYGGFVRELDGFVVSRHHDMHKIASNKEGWIQWMMVNLDWARSFPDMPTEKRVKFLREQVKEFSSGVHLSALGKPDSSGIKGSSSIAKRMSKSRQFHFKSAELEYEYGKQFGSDRLADAFFSSLEQRGRSNGLMQALGPNPEMNVRKAADALIKYYKEKIEPIDAIKADEQMKNVESAIKKAEDIWFPILTGRTMIPGNFVGASIESAVLTSQRLSSLGASSVASVAGDPMIAAMNFATLDKGISGFMRGYVEIMKGLGRNLKDPEVLDILTDIGITNDFAYARLTPRFSEDSMAFTKVQRTGQALENKFFYFNGQYFLDTRFRAATGIMLATRIGRRIDKTFDQLDDGYKRLFIKHDIGSDEWDLARQSVVDYKGNNVISIEGINRLEDRLIDVVLNNKGVKPTNFQRVKLKDDIINKFRGMFQDQQGYNILSADDRARGVMFGGGQSGTRNSVWKFLWQFKQFPYAFVQKAMGSQIYSNSLTMTKVQNVAALMLATTIGGYMAAVANDVLKGREPKGFTKEALATAALRGGGLGIYSDFLYTLYEDRYGSSLATTLLGPTVGDIETIGRSISGVIQGDTDKAGDNAARFVTSNLPFVNIPGIKLAADYLVLNSVKELISPGSLRRAEAKLKKDYDQEYFWMQPSKSMLVK